MILSQFTPRAYNSSLLSNLLSSWSPHLQLNKGQVLIDFSGRKSPATFNTLDPFICWVPLMKHKGIQTTATGRIDATSPINELSECTISAWIYRNTTATKQGFGHGSSAVNRFNVLWWTDNNIYYSLGGNVLSFTSTRTGWNLLTFSFKGNASPRLVGYLNGKVTVTSSPAATNIPSSTSYAIGHDAVNGFCPGIYSEILNFSKALTYNEVNYLYGIGPGGIFEEVRVDPEYYIQDSGSVSGVKSRLGISLSVGL